MFLWKAFKKYTYFYHVHIIHVLAKSEIQMFNSTEIEQLKKTKPTSNSTEIAVCLQLTG